MNAEADKLVAELMALAERFAYHSALINEPHIETRTALEQAIRRAVDWGEPAGYFTLDEGTYEHVEQWAAHSMPLYARSQA